MSGFLIPADGACSCRRSPARYTSTMRSVADDLRRETRLKAAALDARGRIELAHRLADDDLASIMVARGLSLLDAKRAFARARAIGRVPSRSNDDDGP